MPFEANHPDAHKNLITQVPRRLETNLSLQRKLYYGKGVEFIRANGKIYEPHLTIRFDMNKFLKLFEYVTRGLAFVEFGLLLDHTYFVESRVSDPGFLRFFNNAGRHDINNNLGNGTVIYRGIQAQDNEFLTLWEYQIYGGLEAHGLNSGNIIAMTAPNRILDNVRRRILFNV